VLIGRRGMLAAEADLRLKRCRLLARLGRPLDDERAAARAVLGRLRAPSYYLDRLAASRLAWLFLQDGWPSREPTPRMILSVSILWCLPLPEHPTSDQADIKRAE
jgi:hypothetical protein